MLEKTPECGGFEFGAGFVVESHDLILRG